MKPKRPDSAKSRSTQQTLDTQLNASKFSQTFTSHSTFQVQKKDEFQKYIQQKQKDPRFKKLYLQNNLPQILQKPIKQEISTKVNSKPFQKRTNNKVNSNHKLQQQKQKQKQQKNIKNLSQSQTSQNSTNLGKWTLNQPANNIKKQYKIIQNNQKQQQMSSSKSFAQKNKQKMNAVSIGMKKVQNQTKDKIQKKIDLKGFKVNLPGKKVKNNQEQKQNNTNINQFLTNNQNQHQKLQKQTHKQTHRKQQKTAQQLQRQKQLLEISRFINDIQLKNIDNYPQRYDQFIQMNQSNMNLDFNLINIKQFLNQPTQNDYEKIQRKIRKNQRALFQQDLSQSRLSQNSRNGNLSTQQTSIDLDRMLDGETQIQQKRQNDSQVFLSSISANDLRQRNLFLTQILKGRVTKQNIDKLQEMDKSQLKMMKFSQIKEQNNNNDYNDDDLQVIQINMMKKKSNRILDRNIIQASGQIYRDCDYLSQENKQRLQKLLNGQIDQSPFQLSEWERFAIRRIDQGIRLYRGFSQKLDEQNNHDNDILQDCLPKDPILRKQAEKKILKDKIDSINKRLRQVDNVVVNQTKIKAMIQNNKSSKISQASQNLIDEKNKQFDEIQKNKKLVYQLILKAQKQKCQIQKVLKQIQKQYAHYQKDFKQYQKLSVEQIKKIQQNSLDQKKKRLQQIEVSLNQLQKGTQKSLNQFHEQIQSQIKILRQIQNFRIHNQIMVENYQQNQTIQDLDQIFNKKMRQNTNKVNQIQIQQILVQQNKQNMSDQH